jgi:hypothetical protein
MADMGNEPPFDPRFDFRTDSNGHDPDSASQRLKAAHKLLWSKELPGGDVFSLDDSIPDEYLVHASPRGRLSLASDTCVPSWSSWTRPRISSITSQVPIAELERYDTLTYQMGAMLLFPRNGPGANRGTSLNQDRGTNGYIVDRLDLTVECIRLYYEEKDEPSPERVNPLAETLQRWSDFFDLFQDFSGYTDFFLLQDLLTDDGSTVDCFLPFDGFQWWPFPIDADGYAKYRRRALDFVEARNCRMEEWVSNR